MAILATLLGSTVLFTIAKTEEDPERTVPAIITGTTEASEEGPATVDLIVFDAAAKRPPSGIIDSARRGVTLSETLVAGCASPLGATYPAPVDESVVPETASKRTKKGG